MLIVITLLLFGLSQSAVLKLAEFSETIKLATSVLKYVLNSAVMNEDEKGDGTRKKTAFLVSTIFLQSK